jgi:hypothetical protein
MWLGRTFDAAKIAVHGGLEERGLTCARTDTKREVSPRHQDYIADRSSHSRGERAVTVEMEGKGSMSTGLTVAVAGEAAVDEGRRPLVHGSPRFAASATSPPGLRPSRLSVRVMMRRRKLRERKETEKTALRCAGWSGVLRSSCPGLPDQASGLRLAFGGAAGWRWTGCWCARRSGGRAPTPWCTNTGCTGVVLCSTGVEDVSGSARRTQAPARPLLSSC